jgi:hypothetical protein
MPTKPANVLSLGVMILATTALAQTTLAAAPTIELAQAHSTESREACDHAGGRYEEGPGYFACVDGRRSREVPCAERERGGNPCSAAAPLGTPGLIQRAWTRFKNFRMGR